MWWNSLTDYQQILFIVAVTATVIMIIFIVLMLIGFDNSEFDGFDGMDGVGDLDGIDGIHDIDIHGDFDPYNTEPLSSIGGLKIFTVRGVLAFLSIGSWMTMLMVDVVTPWIATIIGIVTGLVAAYLLALALRSAMKLENSGNIDYRKAIGQTATVYLRIPKNRSGKGKINLVVDDRYVEIDAVTDEGEDILYNQETVVTGVVDNNILLVKKK